MSGNQLEPLDRNSLKPFPKTRPHQKLAEPVDVDVPPSTRLVAVEARSVSGVGLRTSAAAQVESFSETGSDFAEARHRLLVRRRGPEQRSKMLKVAELSRLNS